MTCRSHRRPPPQERPAFPGACGREATRRALRMAGAALCMAGAALRMAGAVLGIVAAPTAAAQGACVQGPECPYPAFGDEAGHYRIEFARPLVRLAPPDDGRPDGTAAAARRASFASVDGGFQLDLWAVPNVLGRTRLDRPPAPGTEDDNGWRVTYRASGPTWSVASGFTRAGHVFYERRDIMCGGKTLTGFVAVYRADPASRATFDPWIKRTRVSAYRCSQ